MIYKKPLRILWLAGIVLSILVGTVSAQTWNPNFSVGTVTGNYNFSYNQTPDQIVTIYAAAIPNTGITYTWYSGPTPILSSLASTGVSGASYSFSSPLTQTTYFALKATNGSGASVWSNVIKISLVSVNWEDINYVREDIVDTINIGTWQAVDQLPIGEKLQVTNYVDGIGRKLQTINRQTATPASPGGAWGDLVQFSVYDAMGRETRKYLPYTTTTQSGKYKTTQLTEQPQYYSTVYNESNAFDSVASDNSPLNRVARQKESGAAWAPAPGIGTAYDVNRTIDSVQIWTVDYVQGDAPVNGGIYPAGTLYKLTTSDENNKLVVEYLNRDGKIILKKVQIGATTSTGHTGWICTYYVYDDLLLLRYQIQPMGVQYLNSNGWSFAGTNGATVLAEQCFQYNYDSKARTIWKKSPGANPLNILYDIRDRPVFQQDGNQAILPTPQWTATLYDELDRPVETVLYNTTESISALQTDINNAVTTTTVNVPAYTQASSTDLVVDSRNTSISQYVATNSVAFVSDAGGSFTSADGDSFVAFVDPLPSSPAYSGVTTTMGSPISAANLANSSVTTVVKYMYYDNYNFPGQKSFSTVYNNTTAYSTSNPNVQPIALDPRTLDMPTGIQTRVLGTNTWLNATFYYDVHGRHIQMLEDNIRGGVDISTQQYSFDGRLLSGCYNHSVPGSGYNSFMTLTRNVFDGIGRVIAVQKQIGSNPFKTISTYDYDDAGRIKTKHLDPAYNNPNSGSPDLESLGYTFNIHGQITGINKGYALKSTGYNKWGHFFGLYLGFDNRDNAFSSAQLDGQVTGLMWSTQGDDAQRKYDYTYDNANRLINATYHEQLAPGSGWINSQTDFSVTGNGGQITYDLNGNLQAMLQKGVTPGTAAPITVDDLRYTYGSFSNKLQSVTDMMTVTTVNGLNGDFKDGTNGTNPDYVYDNNGNLVIDLNKNVQSLNNGAAGTNGIHYNYLDKPDQIRLVGQGTINIVYDADGRKLQKVFIPEAGGLSSVTTYIDDYVYQSRGVLTLSSTAPFSAGSADTLSYINFEDGRIRVMTPSSTSGLDAVSENGNLVLPNANTMGVWDYFILDYQKNVRMILTEETHSAMNTCTMETSRNTAEDPVFGQTGAANEVETTRTPTPGGWQSVNSSVSVSALGNLVGHTVGPNSLQKVMAGDMVSASVQYYFQSASTNTNPNVVANILNSLAGAIGGPGTAGSLIHGSGSAITTQLGNSSAFISAVNPANPPLGTPQAYLTILFFDERFNLVSVADGGVAQQQVASSWSAATAPLGLGNIKAPKNGYAYIYVSNLSDQSVYFDNMVIGITAGNIIEEDHYYAFGLKIAGISSKKLGDAGEGTLKNNYLYNDKELFDDGGLNWLDYGYRNYDPQIGRFPQLDPFSDDYASMTPFQYASNDPIANIDLDGLEGALSTSFSTAQVLGQVVVTPVRTATAASTVTSTLKTIVNFTSIAVNSAMIASNIINHVSSGPAGNGGPKYQAYLQLVATRGALDAIANANSLGLYDLFGGNHTESYSTPEEQAAYLRGRLVGDAFSMAQGDFEIKGGLTAAAVTGGETLGVGAAGGAVVALHGAGTGAVATNDAVWTFARLAKVTVVLKAASAKPPKSTFTNTGENKAAADGRDAHNKYDPGPTYKTKAEDTRLQNGAVPDALDRINKVVRELKSDMTSAFPKGRSQVKRYVRQLIKQYGGKWKYAVDTYHVNPDGSKTYTYGKEVEYVPPTPKATK